MSQSQSKPRSIQRYWRSMDKERAYCVVLFSGAECHQGDFQQLLETLRQDFPGTEVEMVTQVSWRHFQRANPRYGVARVMPRDQVPGSYLEVKRVEVIPRFHPSEMIPIPCPS